MEKTTCDGEYSKEEIRFTYEDPYTAEYRALYRAIEEGGKVKTNPMDSEEDLQILKMVFDKIETV